MKTEHKNGLWYATYKAKNGHVFMGYAPTYKDAVAFCYELIEENNA